MILDFHINPNRLGSFQVVIDRTYVLIQSLGRDARLVENGPAEQAGRMHPAGFCNIENERQRAGSVAWNRNYVDRLFTQLNRLASFKNKISLRRTRWILCRRVASAALSSLPEGPKTGTKQ
jgi:hypothetical protein